MEKAKEILWHMEELYGKEPNETAFYAFCEKYAEKVAMWDEAFKAYDLTDVLLAIDQYWRFKNDKTRPTVAKLLAMLEASNAEKDYSAKDTDQHAVIVVAPAEDAMRRDMELGRCRHLLPVYKQAINYILEDMLAKEMPVSLWRKMDSSARYRQAVDKGLMNNLDDVLRKVCLERYGKEYQFESRNMIEANDNEFSLTGITETLSAHWRMGD